MPQTFNHLRLGAIRAAAVLAILAALACATACSSAPPAPPSPPKVTVPPPPPAPSATESARSKDLTAAASYLAGLAGVPGSPQSAMQDRPEWKRFAKEMGELRAIQTDRRMSKVKPWAETNLAGARKGAESVLYPFGGPDAVYPVALFPGAKTYVLVGLESCGKEIDLGTLSAQETVRVLDEILELVRPFYKESYFITKDMQAELHGRGVFPVLMLFLAGEGASLVDASPATLEPSGKLVRLPVGSTIPKGSVRGLAIDFVKSPKAPVQTLLYFSQDLGDGGLAKHPEFVAFLQSQPYPVTFLKAASYLMWNRDFSTLRSLVLDRSLAVLEDDSGVPFRYFKADIWEVKLFGRYINPVDSFKNSHQPELTRAYGDAGAVPALEFGMGYHRQPARCNLQLALRRAPSQAGAQAAATKTNSRSS